MISRRRAIAGAGIAALLVVAALILPRGPRDAPSQLARARALESEIGRGFPDERPGRLAEAVAAYDKVGEFPDKDHAHEDALRDAAGLLARERKFAEAEARVDRLIEGTPPPKDAPALRTRKGEWREAAGDFAAARRAYLEVVAKCKEAPEAAEAAYRAAVILEERLDGVPGDVLASWEAFAKDFPRSAHAPEALLRLAALYRKLGERERAVAAYQRVVDQYGDSEQAGRALREIANIYGEELDRPKEAAKALKELEEKHGDEPAASGARALREKEEGAAAKKDDETYRDEHYGGAPADVGDLLAKTPREMLAELIEQRLDIRTLRADVAVARGAVTVTAHLDIAHGGGKARRDFILNLAAPMQVDEATFGGTRVETAHEGSRLSVRLASDWPPAEARSLELRYHLDASLASATAEPEDQCLGSSTEGFFPSGVVGDLFTCETTWRVPAGVTVIATGAQVSPPPGAPGEACFAYSTGELPVFAVYFAIGRYRSVREVWRGRPISVCWLTADFDEARARGYLEELRRILDFYTDAFGDAPWPCFSIVEADTASRGAAGIGPACMLLLWREAFKKAEAAGPPTGEAVPLQNLMAHELAHQWWGNAVPVTLAEGWAPWLSEGLASYSDALYLEKKSGCEAAHRHLLKYANLYYEQVLHGPDKAIAEAWFTSRSYRAVAYEKGARILHLLRRSIGDRAFFAGLRRYAAEFRFRESTIDDLRASLERESGEDLRPLFEDWIRRPGFPHLFLRDVALTNPEHGKVHASATVEELGEVFRIPRLPIRFQALDGRVEDRTMAVVTSAATLETDLGFSPVRVEIDPDDDVLKLPGRDTEWTVELAAQRARRRGGGEPGGLAPAAVFSTLDGRPFELDSTRGSVVLLLFYAGSASPCRRALPGVDRLARALATQGVRAYGISLEDAAAQGSTARELGVTLPLLVADRAALDLFGGVPSVPATLIIDRSGVVREKTVGVRSEAELEAAVHALVGEPGTREGR